jgi:hypothetical protein
MTSTPVKVRVQALGGKFLGDDIGGAVITIRDAQTGELFVTGRTTGDAGNLGPKYTPGSSLFTIATPNPSYSGGCSTDATIQWLSPDLRSNKTSVFNATLELDRPRLLEISAFGPVGGLQSAHRVTATEWFVPGQPVTELGLVLVMPGLLVQVLQPATHTMFGTSASPVSLKLEVFVAMMCGCPINNSQGNPWIPADFEVCAHIQKVGAPWSAASDVSLVFTGTTSLFEGTHVFKPGKQQAFYEAVITARQISTGNTGTATVTFFVKPPSN